MKIFSIITSAFIVFGCGIVSLLVGYPERFIERDIKLDEMIGTWEITSKSESQVNVFLAKFPDLKISAPWKTFILNDDGSCAIKIEIEWIRESHNLNEINETSCSWNLEKEEDFNGKITTVVQFDIDYPEYQMWQSLYIFEENGVLKVWSFIGDPDNFNPQDFVKAKE